jgi:hypothetical protein
VALPTYNVYRRVYAKDHPKQGRKAGDVRYTARVSGTKNDRVMLEHPLYTLVGTYPNTSAEKAIETARFFFGERPGEVMVTNA